MSELRILYEDRDFLVIDKPSGVPTTSPDGRDSLARRVELFDARAEHSHPSSRLDAEVSGVVVFARTSRGIEALLAARRSGRYARRYLALAAATRDDAIASVGWTRWSWSIAIDPRDPRKRRAIEPGSRERAERLQEASTDARVVGRAADASLLLLAPRTGRTHQLRVHAARAGVPLLGDVTYGGARRVVASSGAVVAVPRAALHCGVVVVPSASSREVLSFVAPWPAELESAGRGLGLPAPELSAIAEDARAEVGR